MNSNRISASVAVTRLALALEDVAKQPGNALKHINVRTALSQLSTGIGDMETELQLLRQQVDQLMAKR